MTCELPQLLAELGADAASVFAGSGIDPQTLTANSSLPFDSLLGLLDRAVRATNCTHLDLLLGSRFRLEHHGIIGRLMLAAPTLGKALADYIAWQPGYSSGAIVYLSRMGNDNALGYSAYAGSAPGTWPLYDAVAAISLRMLHALTDGKVKPLEVHLAHAPPEDATIYSKIMRLPVRFNQQRTCVILEEAALRMRLPGENVAERQSILAEIRSALPLKPPDYSGQVRHTLRYLLLSGPPHFQMVSEEMGLHPRTLRRRLAEEGTTFEALRDEVRFAVACELLEQTDLPVSEIAAGVGYAAPGVFSEAFQRWSGTTPSGWRKAVAHSQGIEFTLGDGTGKQIG